LATIWPLLLIAVPVVGFALGDAWRLAFLASNG
jgi:hypothetical protein